MFVNEATRFPNVPRLGWMPVVRDLSKLDLGVVWLTHAVIKPLLCLGRFATFAISLANLGRALKGLNEGKQFLQSKRQLPGSA
jgi:hypothetical protein